MVSKPDSVELSRKKIVRNTGIGTAFGAAIGVIKAGLKNKNTSFVNTAEFEEGLRQAKQAIYKNISDTAIGAISNLTSGEALTKEQAAISKVFRLDTPLMRYLYQNKDYDFAGCLKTMFSDTAKAPAAARSFGTTTFLSMKDGFFEVLKKNFVEHAGGQKDHSAFMSFVGDEYNKLVTSAINGAGKEATQFPLLVWIEKVNPSLIEEVPIFDNFTPLEKFDETYHNLTKDKVAEVQKALEVKANKLAGAKGIKNILKSAGVCALIVGGAALIGTLVYNHSKKSDKVSA